MRLIITGCEYTGKTTLANEIARWKEATMGPPIPPGMPGFHDHFALPEINHGDVTDEEAEQVWALSPRLKMLVQNHQVVYHLNPSFYADHDNILVGFHIEDAVYAPRYYGYGEGGERSHWARIVEGEIVGKAFETILVLLTASPETIRERMRADPHPRGLVKDEDVEEVLADFETEFGKSILRYKFALDTSNSTPEETLERFLELATPMLRDSDRLRMRTSH